MKEHKWNNAYAVEYEYREKGKAFWAMQTIHFDVKSAKQKMKMYQDSDCLGERLRWRLRKYVPEKTE